MNFAQKFNLGTCIKLLVEEAFRMQYAVPDNKDKVYFVQSRYISCVLVMSCDK